MKNWLPAFIFVNQKYIETDLTQHETDLTISMFVYRRNDNMIDCSLSDVLVFID